MTKIRGHKDVEKKNAVLQTLKIEYVEASSIQPNSYNPNRQSPHDFELLVLSMSEDGFTQPIIVHQETRQIVDGEHRWTGAIVLAYLQGEAKKAGKPVSAFLTTELIEDARRRRLEIAKGISCQIPAVFVDMTPEQMRIATLRHNRARGSEDLELSVQVLRDLQELGALEWAQDSLMLTDEEVNRLLDDIPTPEALAGEEFSEPWLPDPVGKQDQTLVDSGSISARPLEGQRGVSAMTPEAIEKARGKEREIKEARTEEERQARSRERVVYRLNLIFSDDEAEIVTQALGDQPAVRLLELCRQAVASQESGVPQG